MQNAFSGSLQTGSQDWPSLLLSKSGLSLLEHLEPWAEETLVPLSSARALVQGIFLIASEQSDCPQGQLLCEGSGVLLEAD